MLGSVGDPLYCSMPPRSGKCADFYEYKGDRSEL